MRTKKVKHDELIVSVKEIINYVQHQLQEIVSIFIIYFIYISPSGKLTVKSTSNTLIQYFGFKTCSKYGTIIPNF